MYIFIIKAKSSISSWRCWNEADAGGLPSRWKSLLSTLLMCITETFPHPAHSVIVIMHRYGTFMIKAFYRWD